MSQVAWEVRVITQAPPVLELFAGPNDIDGLTFEVLLVALFELVADVVGVNDHPAITQLSELARDGGAVGFNQLCSQWQ